MRNKSSFAKLFGRVVLASLFMFVLSGLVCPTAAIAQDDGYWYATEIINEQNLPYCVHRIGPINDPSTEFLRVITDCPESVTLELLECTNLQCGGNSVTLTPENREDETHIVTSADLGLPVEGVAEGTESTATVGWVYRDSEGIIELSIQHLTNDSRPPDGLGTCNHRPSSGGAPAVPALLVILAVGCTVRLRS